MGDFDLGGDFGSMAETVGQGLGSFFQGATAPEVSVEDPNVAVGSNSFVPDMSQYGDTQGGGFGAVADAVGDKIQGGLEKTAGFVKPILPLVGLGTAGMGLAAGIQGAKTSATNAATQQRAQRLQENIAGQQSAAAAPLTNFGQQQLDASTSGKIPDQIQAQIDQWAQGAKARINDYFARSGQGNSLQLQQKLSEIDQAAKAMGGTFLQEESKLGINSLTAGANALGGAGNTASTIGQGAATGNANIATLMSEANKALAMLEASGGKV